MSDGSVIIDTKLNNSEFKKGINELESIGKKGLKGIGVATGIAVTGLSALGGYALKVGSDFEAGMSKVQAISGATQEEINQLTEKAKEMGAKTKFSASESAEAFQYMAMAGWKTGDMLNGIEGIMNLAAASGENLGSVSDIVTDALTAFGLQAKDSAHFADVLAKASSSSNTNVGLMGATFKYVAPIAGSMKYSIEDTAVAIGLMANAGIKGEQAGTALRSMLTRLVKPPKEAAEALKKLNISAKNSDGTMKPLSQTLKELRTKFSKLNDSQKASYASSIAGTEAMSGMLAIVNASDDDFKKLTKEINNSEGATKDMANTMNNNLKGATTIMKSNMESLGIAIYDKFKVPATKGIKSVTEALEKLTKSTSSGQLSRSLDKIASGFGKLIEKGADLITKILPKLIDGLAWVLEHGETIAGVVLGVVGAVKGFEAISKAIGALKTATTIMGTLKEALNGTEAIAMGASNGIGMFTGATSLLCNPVGLATTALIGLITAYTAHHIAVTKEKASLEGLRDEVDQQKATWEELGETRQDILSKSMSEIDTYEKLADELKQITDENGKVKEGYETRAQTILGILNKALGTEYSMTGNVIDKYQELKTNIDNVIASKKAESVLNAYQAEYGEAIKEQAKATETLVGLKRQLAEAAEKIATSNGKEKKEAEILYSSIAKQIGEETTLISQYGYTISNYEDLQKASAEGSAEAIGKAVEKIGVSYETATTQQGESLEQQIVNQGEYVKLVKESLQEAKKNNDEYQAQILDNQLKSSQKQLDNLTDSLIKQTSTVRELSEDQKKAWKTLAEQSYSKYREAISKMPEPTQKAIQDATGVIATDTSLAKEAGNKGKQGLMLFENNLKLSDATKKEVNNTATTINNDTTVENASKGVANDATENYKKRLTLKEATQEAINKASSQLNSDTSVEGGAKGLAQDANRGFNSNVNGTTWGSHLASNIANGLASSQAKKVLESAANSAAAAIAAVLHHTTPDKGPMKDDDKWMPDMIDNFVKGIKTNAPKMYKQIEEVAKRIENELDLTETYNKMQATVDFETSKISTNLSTKATLQLAKEHPRTINNDNGTTINNTQNFYEKNTTPYEQQKQARQQLRRVAYGI